MAEYLDVLVLCSDPVNFRHTLNLAQELVHFEHVSRRSELPIRLRRVFPPTLDQLRKEFAQAETLGREPAVFHFLGHGDDDGLYFENEHGEFQLVKGHELRAVLAPSPVNLVLLNACWSATKRGVSLCDFLTRERVAQAAIGHERPAADTSAIEFARQFYALVTEGRTVRDACLRAAHALAEQGQPGAAEVKLVGDGRFPLTDGLPAGARPCVIDMGLPRFGHLPDAGVFYGRGEELVQISHALADARVTGFALWGLGGIGKTALAKASGRRNAWRYQGAVWVDIRDATQKTTAELLRLALCRLHPRATEAVPGAAGRERVAGREREPGGAVRPSHAAAARPSPDAGVGRGRRAARPARAGASPGRAARRLGAAAGRARSAGRRSTGIERGAAAVRESRHRERRRRRVARVGEDRIGSGESERSPPPAATLAGDSRVAGGPARIGGVVARVGQSGSDGGRPQRGAAAVGTLDSDH